MNAVVATTLILTLAVLPGATAIALDLVDGYRERRAARRRARQIEVLTLQPRRGSRADR